jgi:hypothetical protein
MSELRTRSSVHHHKGRGLHSGMRGGIPDQAHCSTLLGTVKLSAGRFPYWTMGQWPEKQLSPEDFSTVPWYGFSGRAKELINT